MTLDEFSTEMRLNLCLFAEYVNQNRALDEPYAKDGNALLDADPMNYSEWFDDFVTWLEVRMENLCQGR